MTENKAQFSWRPLYAELVKKLVKLSSKEMLELASRVGISEGLRDQDPENNWIEMAEVDPFTFLSMLNKFGAKRRIEYLNKMLPLLNPELPPVTDVDGLPTANAQRVWWFGYKYIRKADDIPNLNLLFSQAVGNTVKEAQFDRALRTYGVAHAKLTEGLFYIDPEKYLPINSQTIPFLKKLGISPSFSTYKTYLEILQKVSAASAKPFYEISYEAFLENSQKNEIGSTYMVNEKIKFWKYSPGKQAYRWIDDCETQSISISFSSILQESLENFKSQQDLEAYLKLAEGKNSNQGKNLFDFKIAEIGDIIFANKGRNVIVGIGVIDGGYRYEVGAEYRHTRMVRWLTNKIWKFKKQFKGPNVYLFQMDTFSETKYGNEIINSYIDQYPEYTDIFKKEGILKADEIDDKIDLAPLVDTHPKNIILYGPPGTGKTYTTIDLAVEIVDGQKNDEHKSNKRRFDALLGSQIEFITFHQNYTYEDFVTGIKPALDDTEGSLRFGRHEGIFYKIAQRARGNYESSGQSNSVVKRLLFEEVFSDFIQPLDEQDQEIEIKMKSALYFHLTKVNENTLDFRKSSGGTGHSLSIATLKRIYEGGEVPLGLTSYYKPLTELLIKKGTVPQSQPEPRKNYVLVIDEINRANMSRVFGELITLLEDDKRLGTDNALQVVLPSGELFAVPPNLYLVGTMNTADKSLALLDIALRRRFEFVGMYPKYDLPGMDEDAAQILSSTLLKQV